MHVVAAVHSRRATRRIRIREEIAARPVGAPAVPEAAEDVGRARSVVVGERVVEQAEVTVGVGGAVAIEVVVEGSGVARKPRRIGRHVDEGTVRPAATRFLVEVLVLVEWLLKRLDVVGQHADVEPSGVARHHGFERLLGLVEAAHRVVAADREVVEVYRPLHRAGGVQHHRDVVLHLKVQDVERVDAAHERGAAAVSHQQEQDAGCHSRAQGAQPRGRSPLAHEPAFHHETARHHAARHCRPHCCPGFGSPTPPRMPSFFTVSHRSKPDPVGPPPICPPRFSQSPGSRRSSVTSR